MWTPDGCVATEGERIGALPRKSLAAGRGLPAVLRAARGASVARLTIGLTSAVGIGPVVSSFASLRIRAGVEVIDLVGSEGHAVDGLAVLLVAAVAQSADDVDVRALVQVLGRIDGERSPQVLISIQK
jgi:hypothetical protein